MPSPQTELATRAKASLAEARESIATIQSATQAAARDAFQESGKQAKAAGMRSLTQAMALLNNPDENPDDVAGKVAGDAVERDLSDATSALRAALQAATTTAERLLSRDLATARDTTLASIGFGADNARREVREVEVRWELHCSLADDARAPDPQETDLRETVEVPLTDVARRFTANCERLQTSVIERLSDMVGSHAEAVANLGRTTLAWRPTESARAAARRDSPDAEADKAFFWTLMTPAMAAALVTIQRHRPELLQAVITAASAAAATGAGAQMADNVRLGGPPLQGATTAAWSAVPAGLLAGLAGTSLLHASWRETLAKFGPLLTAVAPAHLDLILKGLWETGGMFASQVVARAVVAGMRHALTELQVAPAGAGFDVVAFGTTMGRHTVESALGDVRHWGELQDPGQEHGEVEGPAGLR